MAELAWPRGSHLLGLGERPIVAWAQPSCDWVPGRALGLQVCLTLVLNSSPSFSRGLDIKQDEAVSEARTRPCAGET